MSARPRLRLVHDADAVKEARPVLQAVPIHLEPAPAVEPVDTACEPPWGPSLPGPVVDVLGTRREPAVPRIGRVRTIVTILLSLTVHAAALAMMAETVIRQGDEAPTDAVSVEIVQVPAPASPTPDVAGEGGPSANSSAASDPAPVKMPKDEPARRTAQQPIVEVKQAPERQVVPPPQPNDTAAKPATITKTEPPQPQELVNVTGASVTPSAQPATPPKVPTPEATAAKAVPVAPRPMPWTADLSTPPVIATPPRSEPTPNAAPPKGTPSPEPAAAGARPAPLAVPRPSWSSALSVPPAVATPKQQRETAMTEPATTAELPTADVPVPERRPVTEPIPQTREPTEKRNKASPEKTPAKNARRSVSARAAGNKAHASISAGERNAYFRKLLGHVQRYKTYPEAAERAGITGATLLSITIGRSGQLVRARVLRGSGHALLDKEALSVARRAAPFPPPPDGVGTSTFTFSVTLRFSRMP